MKSIFSSLGSLNPIAKLVLFLIVLAIFFGVFFLVVGFNLTALVVLIVGLIVLAVIFVLFLGFLKWRKKRKADPFERDLAGNTGAIPSGISEASSRARLDDLRQKFEQGVEMFRSHGKDLYSLPWYAIVGEPGSGKTEALRHSNIGFPPGLQDELQGSGGTINMDWWFTNHAIILDTAGRLMFDESASESNPEWTEFLKLLAKHRPNCPINGLMLVIPVDSLIRDTADEIQYKGGRIASQLDLIQRTLGVRFPIFILITKSDLINGFREFFDELNDPQLQHQIMGWSNPGGLDDPFNPEDVIDHIYTVQERLERRRLGLMLDPVSREGAMARRADEVDAMFAFPESLANVVPRLRRYLELIFVSTEWSSMPLFLRGIYFVSSMREGSALDADLAEAMGISLEQLPDGKIWERDRSYFLRDLFLEKMFRERGLVTRTSNTSQLKRKRRVILLGMGIAAAVILVTLTWFQASSLKKSIVQPKEFWAGAADVFTQDPQSENYPSIIGGLQDHASDEELSYLGAQPVDIRNRFNENGDSLTIAATGGALARQVQRKINVPMMFKLAAGFSGSLSNLYGEERLEAGRVVFELSVLRPLVSRNLKSLGAQDAVEPWKTNSAAAFTELMKIYSLRDEDTPRPQNINLGPLFEYALRVEAVESGDETALIAAREDLADIQDAFDYLYAGNSDSGDWPATALSSAGNSETLLAKGIDRYVAFVRNQWQGLGDSDLAQAVGLRVSLENFARVEKLLHDSYAPQGEGQPLGDLTVWQTQYRKLGIGGDASGAHETIARMAPKLGSSSFADWYQATVDEAQADTTAQFASMIEVLPQPAGEGVDTSEDSDTRRRMRGFRKKLEEAQADITGAMGDSSSQEASLAALEANLLTISARTNEPAYRQRGRMYAAVDRHLTMVRSTSSLINLAIVIDEMDREMDENRTTFNTWRSNIQTDPINRGIDAIDHLLSLVRRERVEGLIGEALRNSSPPLSSDQIAELVTQVVADGSTFQPEKAPALAMTQWTDDSSTLTSKYHRTAGPACITMLGDVASHLRDRAGNTADANTLDNALQGYTSRYLNYWKAPFREEQPFIKHDGNWSQFRSSLNFDYTEVNRMLREFARLRREAINGLKPGTRWPATLTKERLDAIQWLDTELVKLAPDQDFENRCARWWNSWRSSCTGDFNVDRRNILGLDSSDFLREYLALYGGTASAHSVDYWKQLTRTCLEVLGDASDRITNDSERTLETLNWFPLAKLHENASLDKLGTVNSVEHRQLDWSELLQARNALEQIRPDRSAAGATLAVGAIGNPATKLGLPELDNILIRIRGKTMTVTEQQHFDRLATMVRALPVDPDDDPLVCQITYRGDAQPSDGRGHVYFTTPLLRVDQKRANGTVQSSEFRLDGRRQELLKEEYPGSAQLVFALSSIDGTEDVNAIQINGPWSLFAMLHKYKSTRSKTDDKVWTVEIPVSQDGREFVLYLEIKFDTTIPLISDWP